jgi:hypothetical protein
MGVKGTVTPKVMLSMLLIRMNLTKMILKKVSITYLAFVNSYESSHESNKYATPYLHDSFENEFEEEDDVQNTYNTLFEKFYELR